MGKTTFLVISQSVFYIGLGMQVDCIRY